MFLLHIPLELHTFVEFDGTELHIGNSQFDPIKFVSHLQTSFAIHCPFVEQTFGSVDSTPLHLFLVSQLLTMLNLN